MKTVEETRRELFEVYCVSDAGGYYKEDLERDAEGNYTVVWDCWDAFNAALDAVEIELPKLRDQPVEDHYNWSACELKCRAAIESTNLGIKVK